jgi:hypothetical protein
VPQQRSNALPEVLEGISSGPTRSIIRGVMERWQFLLPETQGQELGTAAHPDQRADAHPSSHRRDLYLDWNSPNITRHLEALGGQ